MTTLAPPMAYPVEGSVTLVLPGDEVYDPIAGAGWVKVRQPRVCIIPAHGPLCTALELEPYGQAAHYAGHQFVWMRRAVRTQLRAGRSS